MTWWLSTGNTASRSVNCRRPWARQWQRIRVSSSSRWLAASASDITIGGSRPASRRPSNALKLSPACARPE